MSALKEKKELSPASSHMSGTVLDTDIAMGPRTILLADDDVDMRDMVQQMLEENGYEVIPARTGRQALEFLATNPRPLPEVVILDLMMPLVTGWQVLEAIQHDPVLAKVPVVVLTAVNEDRPTGAAAFLRKPFRLEALLETVQRLRAPPS
jgi:two-component system response regulator CpxR